MIDLNNVSESVWQYTCQLAREPFLTRLTIRCAKCQGRLGKVATTKLGPIFISSWPIEAPLHIGYVVNGRVLPPGEAARRDRAERKEHLVSHTGVHPSSVRDGMFAAVAIPAELPQTYAPFYVRCHKDGDAVLEHRKVLEESRGKVPLKVAVSMPFEDYLLQRNDGLRVIKTSSVEARQYGSVGMPLEEFKEWWARGGG